MPQSSDQVLASPFLRLLILGPPKIGKTTTCVSTAPPGGVYVIECDGSESALAGAARRRQFDYDLVKGGSAMNGAVETAKKGVTAGKYQTVILDTLSGFAEGLEEEELRAAAGDPRRAYRPYGAKLRRLVRELFALQAHTVITSHFMDLGSEIEGQTAKSGNGILPLLAGSARQTVSMLCPDVLFLDFRPEKGPDGKMHQARKFLVNPKGVWGVGSRAIDGTHELPADLTALLATIQALPVGPAQGA